jgi:hypothetical protein
MLLSKLSKPRGALSELVFNFALEYAIWDYSIASLCLWSEYTGRHSGYYKGKHGNFIDARKEFGPEINVHKIKCMLLYRRQKMGQNH